MRKQEQNLKNKKDRQDRYWIDLQTILDARLIAVIVPYVTVIGDINIDRYVN